MTVCIKCGDEIHPKRIKIFPNTKVCVKCSSTSKLVGVPITMGEGDHTYNDISIMPEEVYNKLYKHRREEQNNIDNYAV